VFFENEYERFTDSRGILESWNYFMAPVNVRMESGDRFEFNWNPHGETLLAPFEIVPGVVIPPGSYDFTRWRVEVQTSDHRPLQFGNTTWFGSFYDGHLTQWQDYVSGPRRGRIQREQVSRTTLSACRRKFQKRLLGAGRIRGIQT
jgi:hypothetical protein